MSLAAHSLTVLPLLSLSDLHHRLKLPAKQKAKLKWALSRFEGLLDGLLSESFNQQLLKEASQEFIGALIEIRAIEIQRLIKEPSVTSSLIAQISQVCSEHIITMRKFFKDVNTADDAEWAIRWYSDLTAMSLMSLEVANIQELEELNFNELDIGEFGHVQTLIFTIFRAIEKQEQLQQAEQLARIVFRKMEQMIKLPWVVPIELDDQELLNFAEKVELGLKERPILRQARQYLRDNMIREARELLASFQPASDFSKQTSRIRELLRPPVLRTISGDYPNTISDNMDWIRSHSNSNSDSLRGQWVALYKGTLLGANSKLLALRRELEPEQLSQALFMKLD